MFKKQIPNAITSLNLFSGCIGVVFAFNNQLEYAVYCIWLAGFFDFFDGLSARLLKVSSPIGKELDSLADMVTFGFLPSVILFQFIAAAAPDGYLKYCAFLIAVFSAYRLAKFNTDDRQSDQFIGLPTPANALFISGMVFLNREVFSGLFTLPVLIGISLVFSYLLVAEIPMIALKFKNLSVKDNWSKYLLLLGSLVLIITLKFSAIPFVILFYLALSILQVFVTSRN
jgi:CDP-diacylglycerol--serine O-phosphatidyltransferase